MPRSTRSAVLTLWVFAAWALTATGAQAYVDAGSTSVIFQALVAGLAAAGTGLAVFKDKIRAKMSARRRGADEDA